jgi:hypothetical protein
MKTNNEFMCKYLEFFSPNKNLTAATYPINSKGGEALAPPHSLRYESSGANGFSI